MTYRENSIVKADQLPDGSWFTRLASANLPPGYRRTAAVIRWLTKAVQKTCDLFGHSEVQVRISGTLGLYCRRCGLTQITYRCGYTEQGFNLIPSSGHLDCEEVHLAGPRSLMRWYSIGGNRVINTSHRILYQVHGIGGVPDPEFQPGEFVCVRHAMVSDGGDYVCEYRGRIYEMVKTTAYMATSGEIRYIEGSPFL